MTTRKKSKKSRGKSTARPSAKAKARSTKKTTKKAAKKKATRKPTSTKKKPGTKKATMQAAKRAPAKKATTVKKASTKKAVSKTKSPSTKIKKAAAPTKKAASKTATKRAKAPASKVKATKKKTKAEIEVEKPPAALPTRTASKEAPLAPTGLGAHPTEDLWKLYHKENLRSQGTKTKEMEELRNALIERHYPLVRYIAERLLQTLPKSIELDDLISAGLFGLMDAIRGFDTSRGIKFKTYCSTRIRGSILDQLRSQDWVPRLVRLKASKIEKALQKLTGSYGREPTHAELAKVLEMEHGDLVREIQDARAKTMFSLSEKWEDGDDEGSAEKVEILEDKSAVDPVAELNRNDLMGYITRSLTQKERFIIERYYRDGHTMREIGELLSLTESRVCQIHSNVMGRLKNLLSLKEESLLT